MQETYVEFVCPACSKDWEVTKPFPDPKSEYVCPDCGEERRAAEFARTDRGVELLKQFA
ncbi:hypothetical protein [Natronomonas sp. EA1]|uniref:DUF7836 family putative zinc-binding protein n=1 Tax=Natronomonas sp. EA1 TaxID=3421655 RepID=UPI003EBA9428